MIYSLITTKSIEKELEHLPNNVKEKVYNKILQLSENPRIDGVTKLKGYDNEYRVRIGDYRIRLRIGDYRIRYEINDKDKIVLLLQCKHRRDVYRK